MGEGRPPTQPARCRAVGQLASPVGRCPRPSTRLYAAEPCRNHRRVGSHGGARDRRPGGSVGVGAGCPGALGAGQRPRGRPSPLGPHRPGERSGQRGHPGARRGCAGGRRPAGGRPRRRGDPDRPDQPAGPDAALAHRLQPARRHPQPLGPRPHVGRVQRRRRRGGGHRHGPAGAGQRPGRVAARARPCQRCGRAAANPRSRALRRRAGAAAQHDPAAVRRPGAGRPRRRRPARHLGGPSRTRSGRPVSVPVPLDHPAFPPGRRRVAVTLDPGGGGVDPIVEEGCATPPTRWTRPAGRCTRPNRPTSVPPPRYGCGWSAPRSPRPGRSWTSSSAAMPAPSCATRWPTALPWTAELHALAAARDLQAAYPPLTPIDPNAAAVQPTAAAPRPQRP